MGGPAVGRVVIVDFPYSNYLSFKKRPALIIALADFDNLIICQITSKKFSSQSAVTLSKQDFVEGKLPIESYIRPDKILTIEPHLVEKPMGLISERKILEVRQKLAQIFELSKER